MIAELIGGSFLFCTEIRLGIIREKFKGKIELTQFGLFYELSSNNFTGLFLFLLQRMVVNARDGTVVLRSQNFGQ
jgi:hypothetical protein